MTQPLDDLPQNEPLPLQLGFRHLLVFQFKLFADAFRDFMFSPLSLAAFLYDAITRPNVRDSLSYKMMLMGRRSDRVINLFDEYTMGNGFTLDETVAQIEAAVQTEIKKRKDEA